MQLFKKPWLLSVLFLFVILILIMILILPISNKEEGIEFEYQEGVGNTVEFELLLENMVYSFVHAKLLSDNYMDFEIENISIDDTEYEEVLLALSEAEKALGGFEKVLEEVLLEALEYEDELGVLEYNNGRGSFISKVSAMNLWDPTLQEVSPQVFTELKEGSPVELEISEEEKIRRIASLYRNAPKGSKVRAFENLTETLQADVVSIRNAVIDLGEAKREYHEGNLRDMEMTARGLEIAVTAGDVALFGLDVATGPIPTSLGLRLLARSILTVKGVDAALAIGEGVSIAIGDEYNRAGFIGARETYSDLLTVISLGDIATSGVSSFTDPTKLVGTLKFTVDQVLEENENKQVLVKPNVMVLDLEEEKDKAFLKLYYTPNIQKMIVSEEEQIKIARELRVNMIENVESKLEKVREEMAGVIGEEYFKTVIDFDNPGLSVDDISYSNVEGITDMDAFRNCLCRESCKAIDFICGGGTICSFRPEITESDNTPSCSKLSNGVCRCAGFGCYRTQMIISGDAFEKCYTKYVE